MSKHEHPLKGEFDTETAQWTQSGELRIGFADNGLVAVRHVEAADDTILIYTPEEWDAFVASVKDGEFDLEVLQADAREAAEQAEHPEPPAAE